VQTAARRAGGTGGAGKSKTTGFMTVGVAFLTVAHVSSDAAKNEKSWMNGNE
jgi:hypothetical protein